jgi:hypothetical protein
VDRIEQNEKLREFIVDLADLWDGKESEKYGHRLQSVLDELGIKDTPKFYSKENINSIIDELTQERKNK